MPPQLVALSDGPDILLDKPILLLGRHQECDVQLGSRKVSRRHCCVAQVNDYFVVRDLGSTNGIRINGIRVLEGSLRPGDELTIGNQRYQLEWAGRTPNEQPAKPAAKRRAAKVPPAPAPAREERLESSENPVPLPEPNLPAPGNGTGGPHPPASVRLPDDLHLKPLSREQQRPAS